MNLGTPSRLEIGFENCEVVAIPIQFIESFDANGIFSDAKYYGNQGLFAAYESAEEFRVDIKTPFEFDQEHTHLFEPVSFLERLEYGDIVSFYLIWEEEKRMLTYYVKWNADRLANEPDIKNLNQKVFKYTDKIRISIQKEDNDESESMLY